eukprot:TRINITY_DN8735_c1_g2_i2.p1 TRINITY_DN8735_c1_g2~~TRINITY_DN8735_c1_g2_i2.p1  ORF type:complete len:208 (+),score=56.61 TRINITY_DN8735_c1_g2_i2:44-667(+)
MAPTLSKYEEKDLAATVAVLTSAFMDDPVFIELFGKEGMQGGVSAFMEEELLYRGVDTYVLKEDDEVLGAIVLGDKPTSFWNEELALAGKVRKSLGFWAVLKMSWLYTSSLESIIKKCQKWKKARTHIRVVGVGSASHGKGYGTVMMSQLLAVLDKQGKGPSYLESSNPRNLTFYERNGFVAKETIVWRSAVLTPMVRGEEPEEEKK